jgi:hypothetical protein
METKICVYEETPISFNLTKGNGMMINATEMAKVFDKKVEAFTRNEDTRRFIESCLKNGNPRFLNSENSRFLNVATEEDLIISRQKSGTWMHRVLALKFAAWLNSDFEVWVYSTIEQLLFGKYVEREKSFERTLFLQKEADELKEKPDKTGEDFYRYLNIERELKREKAVRKSLTVENISDMKDLFE